ncbi:hypothetical protein BGK51_03405 [Shigella sp. FC569]|nr:hypothetical protein BGK51_03405 [Shigella sp. FC569]
MHKKNAFSARRRRGKGARIEGWKAGCFIWGRIARDTPAVKPVLKNHIKTWSGKQAVRMRLARSEIGRETDVRSWRVGA